MHIAQDDGWSMMVKEKENKLHKYMLTYNFTLFEQICYLGQIRTDLRAQNVSVLIGVRF